jgi:hypothetical protein
MIPDDAADDADDEDERHTVINRDNFDGLGSVDNKKDTEKDTPRAS